MQKMSVELIDDLDGGEAHETVLFGLDGMEFEIDLSNENAENLRELLGEYTEHARRTGGRKLPRKRVSESVTVAPAAQVTAKEIREWMESQGRGDELNARGRIPGRFYDEYNAQMAA